MESVAGLTQSQFLPSAEFSPGPYTELLGTCLGVQWRSLIPLVRLVSNLTYFVWFSVHSLLIPLVWRFSEYGLTFGVQEVSEDLPGTGSDHIFCKKVEPWFP